MALDNGDAARPTRHSSTPPKRERDGSEDIEERMLLESKTARLEQRQQHIMDKLLIEYDETTDKHAKLRQAIDIFLRGERSARNSYSGARRGTLIDVLECVETALSKRKRDLEAFFGGKLTENHIKRAISPNDFEVFCLFRAGICSQYGPSPTIEDVKTLINQWNEEIIKGVEPEIKVVEPEIKGVEPEPLFAIGFKRALLKQIRLAKIFNDDEYMDKFVNMLKVIETINTDNVTDETFKILDTDEISEDEESLKIGKSPQDDGSFNDDNDDYCTPFVFICAPSGSGKSVFGLNLGDRVPSLYWIHKPKASQGGYLPFQKMSQIIQNTVLADLECHFKGQLGDKEATTLENVRANMLSTPFKYVHLIVNLFKQLDSIKSRTGLSWIKAQAHLTTMSEGVMTIDAGREAIKKFRNKHDFPLCVFIDEFSPVKQGDGIKHSTEIEEHRLNFTSTLNRALGIIPILAGTDAKSCTLMSHSDSGARDSKFLWGMFVNDLPAFKLEHLIARCKNIKRKIEPCSESHPAVIFLEFIKRIRLYENPWIIHLALKYLEDLDDGIKSWDGSLDQLLLDMSTEYIGRKGDRLTFSLGQFGYIMSHKLDSNGNLLVNHLNESCINGHTARLAAVADKYVHPFTSIVNKNGAQAYFVRERDYFVPCSYFTPFFLAPLTGLMLFGLDLQARNGYHTTFVGVENYYRITCFNAAELLFKGRKELNAPSLKGGKNTGAELEILYHAAAVVASRANGLRGCNMLEFLENFINELEPCSLSEAKPLIVKGRNEFGSRRMPLLAPMSAPGWPKSVVEMLKSCPDGQSAVYGVFKPSLGNEKVDSIIYECGVTPTLTVEPAARHTLNAAVYMRKMFGDDRSLPGRLSFTAEDVTSGPEKKGRKEPSKIYGYLGGSYLVDMKSDNAIALVGECKQYCGNLTLSGIVKIVDRFDSVKDCRTFLVLTLSTSDFSKESVYDTKFKPAKDKKSVQESGEDESGQEQVPDKGSKKGMHVLTHLNERGYYFWYVENGQNDTYELKPIPSQVPNEEDGNDYRFKDVILIGCQKIWGSDLLDLIRRNWAADAKHNPAFQ